MWGEAKTVEFLNKLKANDIRTAAGNAAAITQLMMAGEYPMVLAFPVQQISKSRLDGTPVDGLNPDPATGLWVGTRVRLLARGFCCGNGCRHCPYASDSETRPEIQV